MRYKKDDPNLTFSKLPQDMSQTDPRTFYEDFWSRTEDQRIHGPVGKHTRRLIRSVIRGLPIKSVLDVGCGEGTMLAELFADRNDLRIAGTDISEGALAMARKKNPTAEFRTFDLRNTPLDDRFDLVICSEVMEHLPEDEGALRSMAAMTGRYLVLTTLGGRMRRHETDIGHLRNYEPARLKAMVEAAGLKVVRTIEWGWPFFSPLHRNLIELMGRRTRDMTTGPFGPFRKFIALCFYALFFLNASRRGDQLVILAERDRKAPPIPPLPANPFVSIVIPVCNEERFMSQCVSSLKALDYPADRFEVIFADGRSTDRTADIARSHGFSVVDNPGLKISAGRNAGFAASRGEIVAFTDADCVFDPQWLRKAVQHFRTRPDVGGLSGPTPAPPDQNAFGKGVEVVFELAGIAGGTVHFSSCAASALVDDLPGCNCFYRREALQTVMPTNTSLYAGEDVEMNAALRRNGIALLMTADVIAYHYKRLTPRRFWRQMHVFAIGRLQLGKRDPAFLRPSHLLVGLGIPLFALAVLVGGFFSPLVWLLALVLAFLSSLVVFAHYATKACPEIAVSVLKALVVFVMAWPLGFLRELFFPVTRSRVPSQSPADGK